MIKEEQSICRKCNIQYSESHLPRLLIMCGHTFCESCIVQFISKKSGQRKYLLTCPLDQMTTQLIVPDPSVFPKNLSVLNMALNKPSSYSKITRKLTMGESQQNFSHNRSKSSAISLQLVLANSRNRQQYFEWDKQNLSSNLLLDQFHNNTCLLHQKPLELVCTKDFTKICSSCVIFGEHKGHNVKNLLEIHEMTTNLAQTLQLIQKQTSDCFSRLNSQEINKKLISSIQNMKNQISAQITKRFTSLRKQVYEAQHKAKLALDSKMEQCSIKIFQKLSQAKNTRKKYQQWQQNLSQQIISLQDENDEVKLKVAMKMDTILSISQNNLQVFKYIQRNLFSECEKTLVNLGINANQQQIRRKLHSYCKLEECRNSFLDIDQNKISKYGHQHPLTEEILLEEGSGHQKHQSMDLNSRNSYLKFSHKHHLSNVSQIQQTSRISQKINPINTIFSSSHKFDNKSKAQNKLRKNTMPDKSCQNNQLNNTEKSRAKSKLNNDLGKALDRSQIKSISKTMVSRSSIFTTLKTKQIPQKYEQKIEAILNGTSDTLDLTNGQLCNQKILTIINCIKNNIVTIVKLVKNKITDDCFINIIPHLSNTVMLNVSKNQLTQKSIEYLLKQRQAGKLKYLKSLMIGQNKIMERKNKEILDQLRKTGINICI